MNRSRKLIIAAVCGALLAGATLFYFYPRVPDLPIGVVAGEAAIYPFSVWVNGEPLGHVFDERQTFILDDFPLIRGENKIEARAVGRGQAVTEVLNVYRSTPPDYPKVPVSAAGLFRVKTSVATKPAWLSPIEDAFYDEAAVVSAADRIMNALVDRKRSSLDALFVGKDGSSAFGRGMFKDEAWTTAARAERANIRVARGKHLIMVYAHSGGEAGSAERGVPLVDLDGEKVSFRIRSLLFYYDSDRRLALRVSDSTPEKLRRALVLK